MHLVIALKVPYKATIFLSYVMLTSSVPQSQVNCAAINHNICTEIVENCRNIILVFFSPQKQVSFLLIKQTKFAC